MPRPAVERPAIELTQSCQCQLLNERQEALVNFLLSVAPLSEIGHLMILTTPPRTEFIYGYVGMEAAVPYPWPRIRSYEPSTQCLEDKKSGFRVTQHIRVTTITSSAQHQIRKPKHPTVPRQVIPLPPILPLPDLPHPGIIGVSQQPLPRARAVPRLKVIPLPLVRRAEMQHLPPVLTTHGHQLPQHWHLLPKHLPRRLRRLPLLPAHLPHQRSPPTPRRHQLGQPRQHRAAPAQRVRRPNTNHTVHHPARRRRPPLRSGHLHKGHSIRGQRAHHHRRRRVATSPLERGKVRVHAGGRPRGRVVGNVLWARVTVAVTVTERGGAQEQRAPAAAEVDDVVVGGQVEVGEEGVGVGGESGEFQVRRE
ncbi:hypothetical protein CHGG_02259 [Chaetomium globosum CBS 148.51]|uniref:Uncharacterized protein n=1 Tax=Chaetomium globosum (strain ATCC 6205 / CBS 148.51 / DSM 1962 / NBRC 6347 / NRRL 1970) TaxID=306901 RepID=Q2HBZ5_CHAGB|nr:uncharacterized protein CHGG_02259 [Chaetomium globosum CBS 148.51]EAQ90324.1 hypothetical protein CHGG_02259 [Chaetomium globosum CBS 148.51]